MTRVTRSKKIEVVEDETAAQMETPLPGSDVHSHNALAENTMTTNTMPAPADPLTAELNGLKAAFRTAIGVAKKGRKGKGRKMADQQEASIETGNSEVPIRVIEGTDVAENHALEKASLSLQGPEDVIPTSADHSLAPPSPPARATRQRLSKSQAAAVTGTNLAKSTRGRKKGTVEPTEIVSQPTGKPTEIEDHSSTPALELKQQQELPGDTQNDGSRNKSAATPAKRLDDIEKSHGQIEVSNPLDTHDDSFVEQITSRSPAKRVSRIEDSLEALDQLEEALEAIDEAALANKLLSPEQVSTSKKPVVTTKAVKVSNVALQNSTSTHPNVKASATLRVKPVPAKALVPQRSQSMKIKPAPTDRPAPESRPTEPAKRPPMKRPTSLLPPKQPARSTKPATRPTFELPGEAIAKKLKEKREARLAQRGSNEDDSRAASLTSAPVIKSTKVPTRPNFELPGEAVSRRKKEAHEARIKAQEEEERKKREFKARPIHKSLAPGALPRDTVASRARQSKIGLESIDAGNLVVTKHRASNVGAHRPSIQQLNLANISAPRSPGLKPGMLMRKPSTSSTAPSFGSRTVSDKDVQIQRQRAKEIYNRDARLTDDMERERKEREAAAKRSREEAAERGRQASREWADRQKAKKMAAGSDKGLSASFSPGGQLGLKT